MSHIYIPIKNSDKYVKVSTQSLPHVNDVLQILKGEIAPLDVWLKIAVEYYKQDMVDEFIMILNQVLDPEVEKVYSNSDSKLGRIAMLNALASYYTQAGAQEKDKARRDDYFNKATFHFNKAQKIDTQQALTWVGTAVLLLSRGDTEHAEKNFKSVLDLVSKTPHSISLPILPAQLGHACIQFNKSNYTKALDSYQKVIKQNANCSPTVRLGLGYCYYRLGRMERAKESFKRVLQLDPDNAEALIGLSLVHMNNQQFDKAMELMVQAYQLAPTNSLVLNHLANHYFYKGDYQKVHLLALAAMQNTESSQIRAETCYLIARAHHATEKWSEALNFYHQAVLKQPDFFLAQFGLGQAHLKNGDIEKAITCFEAVLEKQPDNYETLQILGSIYRHSSQAKNITKIKNILVKTTEINPNDHINWFELAQLLENTDPSTALDAYHKGINILKKEGITVTSEILNNVGVLSHKQGLLNEAEEIYLQVIKDSGSLLEDYKSVNITTTYNLARLYETMNNFSGARQLYIGILGEHPNYLDCYMRLASVCRAEGNDFEAVEWIKEALNVDPNNPEAWSLYGSLHLSKEQWNFAQKKFEQILELNKNDPYASLALGNLYYQAKNQNPDKYEKYLTLAESYYTKTLRNNPTNIYAANGLGMVAFEKGNLNLATEIFVHLREAAIDVQAVSLNLAHVYMEKKLYDFAIRLYEGCLKKCNDTKDLEAIYLYLSKALFEAHRYAECKQILKKAIHISPANMTLWYDLALVIEKNAVMVMQTSKKTLYEYNKLHKETNYGRHLLMSLSASKNPKLGLDPKRIKSHIQSMEELNKKLTDEVKALELAEIENNKKREAAAIELKNRTEQREKEDREREAARKAQIEEEERMYAEENEQFMRRREEERQNENDKSDEEDTKRGKKRDKDRSESEDESKERRKDRRRKEKEKRKSERDRKKKRGEEEKERTVEEEEEAEPQEEEQQEQEQQPEEANQEYNDLFGSDEE